MRIKTVKVGTAHIGGALPVIIAGPCVIESRQQLLGMAKKVASVCAELGLPAIFKASFDKANRTSITSYRGPGLEAGLELLAEAREVCGLPITTDVHEAQQVAALAEVVDLIQIPAFLCRQTDLIVAAAESGVPTSIKKGQFLAPWDMRPVVDKFRQAGGKDLVLIERGSSFGYNNLVVDFRGLSIMRSMGVPVIFDATHSVQSPGGQGTSSGGDGYLAPSLMRAAMAVGCEGIFLETHQNPAAAKSDGPNMVPAKRLKAVLADVVALHEALGRPAPAKA